MTQGMPGYATNRRGPTTIADAKETEVRENAALTREERREQKEKELLARSDTARQEKEKSESAIATQLTALTTKMFEMQNEARREQAELQRRHEEEKRDDRERFEARLDAMKNQKPERDPLEMLLALKNMSGSDESTQKTLTEMRRDHQRELERLSEMQKVDAERAQRQVTDERARCDQIIGDEKRRCETRIKEVEDKYAEKDREYRARADQEVQKAKDEAERRLADLDRQHNARIVDEGRNHERDLKSAAAMHQMQLETLKSTYEQRIDGTRSDIKRTESELARARAEADERKDVVGQIAKLKETAEALGMSEASPAEPEDWKSKGLGMLGGVLANLPAMIEQFASVAKGKSAQEVELARAQGRHEMILQSQQQQQAFQGGGGAPQLGPPQNGGEGRMRRNGFRPMREGSGALSPLIPGQVHPSVLEHRARANAIRPADSEEGGMSQGFTEAAPMPMAQHLSDVTLTGAELQMHHQQPPPLTGQHGMAMPPEPQLSPRSALASVPAPAMAPASVAPPAQPGVPQPSDADILQILPLLQPFYEGGAPPALVAQQIVNTYGAESTAQVLAVLGSADRVIAAVERASDPTSPFLLREGKKFLRKVFEELTG